MGFLNDVYVFVTQQKLATGFIIASLAFIFWMYREMKEIPPMDNCDFCKVIEHDDNLTMLEKEGMVPHLACGACSQQAMNAGWYLAGTKNKSCLN